MATAPSTSPDSSASDASRQVESRWWYVVAAVPVFALLSLVFVGWFVGFLLLGTGFHGFGVGALSLLTVLAFVFFGLLGTAMLALFPIAIYLDAEAVSEANVGWDPDGVLYALLAVVSAFATAFTMSVAVAGYYLYQRHQYVGVP